MLMNLVSRCIKQHKRGGYILLMPQYRPDIGRSIAQHFELRFYDYRQEVMLPLGWDAANISLDELDDRLFQEAMEKPLLAFNVEALMTTKPEEQRRQWLYEFIHKPWSNKILLPLAIHQSDAPDSSTNVCDLQNTPLPEQNLINRLAL